MSAPTSAPAPEGSSPPPTRGRGLPIISIVGGLLFLLIAGGLIIFLGLRSIFFKAETNPGIPLEVVKLTPTISASPLPYPISCETIISSGDVEVVVPLPISLTVGSAVFPVAVIAPEERSEIYPAGQSGTAPWICGTVINYVLGLEPTPENEALLANLKPGDEVNLQLSNGVVLSFRFVEQRETAVGEASVFEQQRPRLTLILEKEDHTWQVATSDYVSEREPIEQPAGELAQPGQPVRVGDVQVTVTKGHAQRSAPDLPSGAMYYLVEFSVENVTAAPVESNTFDMQLQDGAGNSYLLSPAASAAGEHGPLGGTIDPGATVQGTAGYLVPDPLAGPALTWTFTPRPGSEARAKVSIPHATETEPVSAGHAEVTISDAFLDGNVLIIEGEVRNTGGGPLTVEVSDVSLTSSAGMSDLRMAAPPLPWTIEPGQSRVIELQYEKPAASAALLELLGYSFEIGGL